uniref:BTB domain-containing protein n=1 Tax=Panagrolaimus sp. ES5 TaxID=591445 RepID=A0AC34FKS3_9BILA
MMVIPLNQFLEESYDEDEDEEEVPHANKTLSFPKQSTASTQTTASETLDQSTALQHSKLHESFNDKKFHDVILVASGGTEITTHRCVLAKYSTHFANLFEESKELPFKISIKDFNAETIQAAVNFMFVKRDAIVGKQLSLFKFAAAYNIPDLLKECGAFVVQRMDVLLSSSICEYITIAYEYNLEELKQKCLKVLVEKRKEIDASKFAGLPKNIIIDVLRY